MQKISRVEVAELSIDGEVVVLAEKSGDARVSGWNIGDVSVHEVGSQNARSVQRRGGDTPKDGE